MSTRTRLSNSQLLARYTDQPGRLPGTARRKAFEHVGPIWAYALADLDESLELCDRWVVVGAQGVVVMGETGLIVEVLRDQILGVDIHGGLSSGTLRLRYRDDAGANRVFATMFTQRQLAAMKDVVGCLEDGSIRRNDMDADTRYQSSTTRAIRDAQALVSVNELDVVWRLLRYMKPYRRQVVVGMTAATLITLLALVPPFITGELVDSVVRPSQEGQLSPSDAAESAWLFIAVLAAAYLLRRAAAWVRLRYMAIIGEEVARDLRHELYSHLQKLSISYYSKKKTGSLITRVSSDTDRLWDFLAFGVVDASLSAIMLLGLSGVLLYLDWRLGLVMTLPVPLLVWGIHKNGKRMQELFLRAWRKWSQVTDVLSDTIPGVRVVKAFDQHDQEAARFDRHNNAVTEDFNRIHGVWTSFWPVLMLAVEASIVLVWIAALPRLLGSSETFGPPLSLGTFIAFLLYTTMYIAPIEIIGQLARVMNRATTSAHRVFEVLDTEPDIVNRTAPKELAISGRVQFTDVCFAYDGLRQTLKHLSFEVAPGEMIGLVGPSGGGKTTISNLLTRFYDPSQGSIEVDGVDIRDLDQGHYRRQVGVVLQDPYLFHGSVLENIRYGCREAGLSEVIRAARVANAHDFICKLPHGYDTTVGERGHTLSGGERQRISIARAILANPKILILDEATSAVDTDTERKIQEAMDRLSAGRTVFAIAHRLSTLRRADRIFVIEEGRLSEVGSHRELITRPSGTYRRLYQLQQELHDAS